MKYTGIIPARYASTRFPGKPLVMLQGKTIIQRVYEQVAPVFDVTAVATDDERIYEHVTNFGGKAVMTGSHHKSGTDRCYEAYCLLGRPGDIVVNVQGDEPFVQTSQLELIKSCFEGHSDAQIATLVKTITPDDGLKALLNPNTPKVVVSKDGYAMYFSRSPIPYVRNAASEKWLSTHCYYKHIGLYAYREDVLRQITSLPQSPLEVAESLEQLRWLENGYRIKVGVTDIETIGIDTPEDLQRAEDFLRKIGVKDSK